MIELDLELVLVLEDDIRFEYNFIYKMNEVMKEAREILRNGIEWDLM